MPITGTPNANDPREQELDSLFDKLGKNPTERKMLRDSYLPQGRIDELIANLKGRLAPEVKTQQTQEQKPAETVPQTTTAAQDTPQTQQPPHGVVDGLHGKRWQHGNRRQRKNRQRSRKPLNLTRKHRRKHRPSNRHRNQNQCKHRNQDSSRLCNRPFHGRWREGY